MVTRYFKAYPGLQSSVMCDNMFNMTEIEVTEGYGNFSWLKLGLPGNFSNSANMDHVLSMFAEFEKLPGNPNFSQISQALPLASLEFIK